MNDREYKYFAFISYTRKDEKWAKWLQYKLEHYRFPVKIGKDPSIPKRISPVFKDTSELSAGVLPDKLHEALEESRYLIVICSPQAAKSIWVDKEVQTFVDLGRTKKIIPFIVSGTPSSEEPENNCFPPALLNMPKEQELIGININEMGRDAATIKVIAYMFNLSFDTLWQRYEKEKRRNRLYIFSAILLFAIISVYLSLFYRERNQQLLISQSRYVTEKAEKLLEQGNNITAARLLLKIMPKDLDNPDRPYIEEAEFALRKAYNSIGLPIHILKHDKNVTTVSFSYDGKFIVTVSDNNVKIWNGKTGKQVGKTMKHNNEVISASFSNDGKLIVTASMDKTAKIWNTKTGKQVGETMKHDYEVKSASFSPDGKYIVTVSDNNAKIWDTKTGKLVVKTMKHFYSVNSAVFSPNGKLIVTTSKDGTGKIWNVQTSMQVGKTLKHDDEVITASFNNDGKLIVTASWDNTAKIWNAETGKQIGETMKHDNWVFSASFSPDGKYIVTASWDKTAKIWNAETGKQVGETMKHDGSVHSASFSPDGKYIVTASDDNTAKIWNAETGKQVKKTMKHDDSVNSASFSPDGKYIVTASNDNTAKIWNAETSKQIGDTTKHDDLVRFASFSDDGKFIVTASDDNTAKITEFIPLQDLLDKYNKLFKNWPLSEEELTEYNFK